MIIIWSRIGKRRYSSMYSEHLHQIEVVCSTLRLPFPDALEVGSCMAKRAVMAAAEKTKTFCGHRGIPPWLPSNPILGLSTALTELTRLLLIVHDQRHWRPCHRSSKQLVFGLWLRKSEFNPMRSVVDRSIECSGLPQSLSFQQRSTHVNSSITDAVSGVHKSRSPGRPGE